jgi:phosphoribosylaminoimidazole-succinocarboxamide synthase
VPEMSDELVESISDRYIELFEKITGTAFVRAETTDISTRIEKSILDYLAN